MSDTTQSSARADADRQAVTDAARREGESVRETAARAGQTLREEGANLGQNVRQRAIDGAEEGKKAAASSLSDFTAAIRKASDELGERDQSMAAGLARQAASGLEQAAEAIEGRSVQDLTRSVADFARRQPGAFLIGAALAGVALGRFARASSDHAGPLGPDRSRADRYDDDWRRENLGASAAARSHGGVSSASTTSSQSTRFDASGERHGTAATGGSTLGSSANPASSSSQADATGLFSGPGSTGSTLNRPGASGSTDTTGLSSSSKTGDRP